MILIMLIALFAILVVLFAGYLVIKRVDSFDSFVYDRIVLKCTNPDCERNDQEEYRYNVQKDTLIDILPCPKCGKSRQLQEKIPSKKTNSDK